MRSFGPELLGEGPAQIASVRLLGSYQQAGFTASENSGP
jgi:hypothetical protein